ncbi:40S ribosomal protein S2 [Cricetulus griseus]|nr:40S ribosomal protein S2 [Cricetulus griseus]
MNQTSRLRDSSQLRVTLGDEEYENSTESDIYLSSDIGKGTGTVYVPVTKKLLMMAVIDDGCTSAMYCTATLGNFIKATFDDIAKTYSYLTLDLWKEIVFTKSPYQEFSDHLFNAKNYLVHCVLFCSLLPRTVYEARISRTILKRNGEIGQPYLVPDFRGIG